MAYIGREPQVGSPVQLLVSHDGVIQNPGTDYTLASNGTQITFTTAQV